MAYLIEKDAVLAEIEKRIRACGNCYILDELTSLHCTFDTFEVKEVNLETSIDDYINSHFTEGCDGGMISDWYKVLGGVHYKDLMELAKHFFELGLRSTITEEDCKLIWNIGDEIPCMPEEEFFKELLKRYKAKKGEEI